MYSMGVNLLSWQQKIDSKFRKVSPMMSCRCKHRNLPNFSKKNNIESEFFYSLSM